MYVPSHHQPPQLCISSKTRQQNKTNTNSNNLNRFKASFPEAFHTHHQSFSISLGFHIRDFELLFTGIWYFQFVLINVGSTYICFEITGQGEHKSKLPRVASYPLLSYLRFCFTTNTSSFEGFGKWYPHCQEQFGVVECPTIQVNSDTIYQEIASDPPGSGLSPTELPSGACGYKPEVPTNPAIGLINLSKQFTNLDKMFTYQIIGLL